MNLYWIYLSLSIITDVVATLCLKQVQGFKTPVLLAMVVFNYLVSYILFALSIRGLQLGTAFAVWSAVGMILIVLASMVVYHEKPDLPAVIGMTLIIVGVTIISTLSKMDVH